MTLNQLLPSDQLKVLIADFKGGGTLYKGPKNPNESTSERPSERLVNTVIQEERCTDDNLEERFRAHKEAGLVKKGGRLTVIKAPASASTEKVKSDDANIDEEEYSENPACVAQAPPGAGDGDEEYSEVPPSSCTDKPPQALGHDNNETSKKAETEATSTFNPPPPVFAKPVSDLGAEEEEQEEEYGECMSGSLPPPPVSIKTERMDVDGVTVKIEKTDPCPDAFSAPNSVESHFSGDYPSPKKEPGLSTPTSSGYWSDDAKEGPYFGKVQWIDAEKTNGFVTVVLDDGDMKHVHVSGYDVRCGAETGDLVEFVLGDDHQHGKAAKRVKLVEKGLPVSEEDQIKAQFSLKRSLEISAGWKQEGDSSKKLRTDEIIDVRPGMTGMSDYSDIADVEDDIGVSVKAESDQDEQMEEELFDHCICDKKLLSRCQMCPFFFLESSVGYTLLEGESATILAKIQGNEGSFKKDMKCLRHLPYPFRFLTQSKFGLLREIGRQSLVPKLSPVFKEHVFITIQNKVSTEVKVKPGDILGICQESKVPAFKISHPFMNEPSTKQQCYNIPIFIKKGDFTCDDNNVHCGFASLGNGKVDYKNCLMKVTFRPDLAKKFKLVKSEVTVQIRNSVWLEIECNRGVFERTNLKDGCIGMAASVMDAQGVETILSRLKVPNRTREARSSTEEALNNEADDENAYEAMLSLIDKDIKTNTVSPKKNHKHDESLLEKTYKGVIGVESLDIPPKGEIETYLYLQDDNPNLDLKSLLKFRARVTNNEEFKYYNNCYDVEEQFLTIVNGICRATRTTRPCVKVKITNPRSDITILRKDAPLALIKVHLENTTKDTAGPVTDVATPVVRMSVTDYLNSKQDKDNSFDAVIPRPEPAPVTDYEFDAVKFLEKRQKRFTRKWDLLCREKTYSKSLAVEEKYPYFSGKQKPKVPFNLKDNNDLTMRVGISQDSKPIKVVDKVNGVFTCTICDTIILDRYSLQDHWYSSKHKQNMKQVQVIAGIEERLAMNRPTLQEMLDQFNLCSLVGLDHVVEVLQEKQEPSYHCGLCSIDTSLSDLMHHLTSLNHLLTFIKEFFDIAWNRFSTIPDFTTWLKSDFECLDLAINKISTVHGRKRPCIVENKFKLEEKIAMFPINSYSARRTELDNFFRRSLTPAEPRRIVQKLPSLTKTLSKSPGDKKIMSRVGVTTDFVDVPPKKCISIDIKILEPPSSMDTMRFVKVTPSPDYFGPCQIRPSFSRTWSDLPYVLVKVTIFNNLNLKTPISKGTELCHITWSQ